MENTVIENYDLDIGTSKKVTTWSRLRDQAYFILGIVGVLWLVEIIDFISGQRLERIGGIYPRDLSGLFGIPLAPFLHANWQHLIANTLPFIVLGGLVIISSNRRKFVAVSCIVAIVAGSGTWLLARPDGYHIGASSLIFGYLGFLLWRAWFGRKLMWTLIAIVAGLLYGGILFTLVKQQQGISWHGHFFGLLGGIAAAYLFTPKAVLPDS